MILSQKQQRTIDLISVLVAKEFTLRYKSTFLGYVWSLLNPLAFAAVFFFVFQVVVRIESPEHPYLLVLITGLFPWQWIQNSVSVSNMAFVGNAPLIKKVPFDRSLLVLADNLNDLIHFIVAIPVILGFMLYYSVSPSIHLLWQLPLLIVTQLLIVQGLGLAIATLNLFFRDLEKLVGIFLMLWFYLTPILYPVSQFPEKFSWALYVNPLASLIHCWRQALLEGQLPLQSFLIALGFGLFIKFVGTKIYRSMEWRFAENV